MNLSDLIAAYSAGHWWILALVVTLYARHMVSDKSRFPWTIPSTWLPTITSLGTLVTGVVMLQIAGKSWMQTLLESGASAVAMGFFDGLLVAFFGADSSKAPALIRFVTMLVDDVFGTKTTTTSTTAVVESVIVKTEEIKPPSAPSAPSAPPSPSAPSAGGAAVLVLGLALCCADTGCAAFAASKLPSDIQRIEECVAAQLIAGNTGPLEIAAKCEASEVAVVLDVFGLLLASPQWRAEHPEPLPTMHRQLQAVGRK